MVILPLTLLEEQLGVVALNRTPWSMSTSITTQNTSRFIFRSCYYLHRPWTGGRNPHKVQNIDLIQTYLRPTVHSEKICTPWKVYFKRVILTLKPFLKKDSVSIGLASKVVVGSLGSVKSQRHKLVDSSTRTGWVLIFSWHTFSSAVVTTVLMSQ